MIREDDRRNFVHFKGGEETNVFSGTHPRQVALETICRLHSIPSSGDIDRKTTLGFRERGTGRIHIYEGWCGPRGKTMTPPSG